MLVDTRSVDFLEVVHHIQCQLVRKLARVSLGNGCSRGASWELALELLVAMQAITQSDRPLEGKVPAKRGRLQYGYSAFCITRVLAEECQEVIDFNGLGSGP